MSDQEDVGGIGAYLKENMIDGAGGKAELKPGQPSTHASGVGYFGPWETEQDGFAEHVRLCTEALGATGVPVHLRSLTPRIDELPDSVEFRMRPYTDASIHSYAVRVWQVVPFPGMLDRMTRHTNMAPALWAEVLRRVAVYTVWERTPVPADDVAAINRCGQAWVACSRNAEILRASGVTVPVHVVPVPHAEDDLMLKLRSRHKKRLPGPVRFYSIGKLEPRKAPMETMLAFLLAFTPGQATLTMKSSAGSPAWANYPTSLAEMLGLLMQDERVLSNGWTPETVQRALFMHEKSLPEESLREFHWSHDVYLALSRGEGFNLPAYDAVRAGRRMVYVPSGGVEDYAAPGDYAVRITGTVPADPVYGWGRGVVHENIDGRAFASTEKVVALGVAEPSYAAWDVVEAAYLMRAAWRDVRSGVVHEPADMATFTQRAAGETMLALLRELDPALGR